MEELNTFYLIIFVIFVLIILISYVADIAFVFIVSSQNSEDTSFRIANKSNVNYKFTRYKLFQYVNSADPEFITNHNFSNILNFQVNMMLISFYFMIFFMISVIMEIAFSIKSETLDTKILILMACIYCISMYFIYKAVFDYFIYSGLKEAHDTLSSIDDETIKDNLIKDNEYFKFEKVFDGTGIHSKIKDYIKKNYSDNTNNNITESDAKCILFTYSILRYIKKANDTTEPKIKNRIIEYLKDPTENKNKDLFYGFTRDDESINGCVNNLDNDNIRDLFGDQYDNIKNSIVFIRSEVQGLLQEINSKLNDGSRILYKDVDQQLYVNMMLLISTSFLIILYNAYPYFDSLIKKIKDGAKTAFSSGSGSGSGSDSSLETKSKGTGLMGTGLMRMGMMGLKGLKGLKGKK